MAPSREALFDLAVNRAARYLEGTGAPRGAHDPEAVRAALELWYLKTRFAGRVPLDVVAAAVAARPAGEAHWRGGAGGAWHPGPPPVP